MINYQRLRGQHCRLNKNCLDKRKTEEEKKKEAIENAKAEWLEAQLINKQKKKNERNTINTDSKDSHSAY